MKTTRYFDALRTRPDRASISDEWIERAIRAPVKEVVQADGRIRRWIPIPEAENRFLRVDGRPKTVPASTSECMNLDALALGPPCPLLIAR